MGFIENKLLNKNYKSLTSGISHNLQASGYMSGVFYFAKGGYLCEKNADILL